MIEYRHLRHALALVEHGNFVRAAEALHVTQPTLTRSIQNLESALGVRLFDRGPRGVEMTEIGRIVLADAKAATLAMSDLKSNVALAKDLELGELNIAVGPFAGAALVGPVVGQLVKRYPRLDLNVVISPWQELGDRLRNRDVDLIVGDTTDLEHQADMATIWLKARTPRLICRVGHPLAGKAAVALTDTFAYPTAGATLPEHIRQGLFEGVAPGTLAQISKRSFPTVKCESWAILKDIIINSDAVSLMLPFMVKQELRTRELAALPVTDLKFQMQFGVTRIRNRTPSAAALAFEELLIAHDAELNEVERLLLQTE